MLRYLDGTSNTVTNPNENYAREFFELFTIGKGPQIGPGDYTNYKEEDIAEAAKLLSGFRSTYRPLGGNPDHIDPDTQLQAGYASFSRHDTSDKTFSSAFNHQTITGATDAADMYRELDDFVEMIFAQPETAKNICRRLYRFFVRPTINAEIEQDIITPLAQTLMNYDYNLAPCLKQLLKSKHFFDLDDTISGDETIGALVKSPLEELLQTINFFHVNIPSPIGDVANHYYYWGKRAVLDVILKASGMTIYEPDSVAGYPAYYQEPGYSKLWFSGSTLIARYKLPEMLLRGKRLLTYGNLGGVQLNIVSFVENSGVVADPSDGIAMVTMLTDYLFAEPPTPDRLNYLLFDVFLDNLSPVNWTTEWNNYLQSGDDSAVKIPLERLFMALISSQEFQLM